MLTRRVREEKDAEPETEEPKEDKGPDLVYLAMGKERQGRGFIFIVSFFFI